MICKQACLLVLFLQQKPFIEKTAHSPSSVTKCCPEKVLNALKDKFSGATVFRKTELHNRDTKEPLHNKLLDNLALQKSCSKIFKYMSAICHLPQSVTSEAKYEYFNHLLDILAPISVICNPLLVFKSCLTPTFKTMYTAKKCLEAQTGTKHN